MISLGLVAVGFGELHQDTIEPVVLAAYPAILAASPERACARASSEPQAKAQNSNGSPVMNCTGIDAFMFHLPDVERTPVDRRVPQQPREGIVRRPHRAPKHAHNTSLADSAPVGVQPFLDDVTSSACRDRDSARLGFC